MDRLPVLVGSKPKPDDAVLGRQIHAPQGSLVLGGIDGLRQRLSASQAECRMPAVREALGKGRSGLALLIQTPLQEQDEHLLLMKKGLLLWNCWRQHNLNVPAYFDRLDFSSMDLQKVDWREASLCETNLVDAHLQEADLRNARLYGAYLMGADLQGANLQGADLVNADLTGANLQGADFRGARLCWAELTAADIRDADFSRSDLRDACLRGTYLKGARFTNAIMPNGQLFEAGWW